MIGISAPAMLLLALSVGLIWFLHSRQKQHKIVPSLEIWRQLVGVGTKMSAAKRKPPITPALLLQLLVVLLLTAGLTQPWWGDARGPEHLIVVFDTDVSWAENGDTAFQQAKSKLAGSLTAPWAKAPQKVSVVAGGPTPQFIASHWNWRKDAVEAAFARVEPSHGPSDWRRVDELIGQLLTHEELTTVLFVGDSETQSIIVEHFPSATVAKHRLALNQRELSIAGALRVEDDTKHIWALDVHTVGLKPGHAELVIEYSPDFGRAPLEWARIKIDVSDDAPKKTSTLLTLPGIGLVSAYIINAENDRSNSLNFVANATPQKLDVVYQGDGHQVLLQAISSIDGVQIFKDLSPDVAWDTYGLAVVDGDISVSPINTNLIVLENSGELLGSVDVDYWNTTHPLSLAIDWSTLLVRQAYALTPRIDEEIILSANGYALITAASTETGRVVRLGFDPAASNWPELSSFPVFIANYLDWIGVRPGQPLPTSCNIGQVCAIDARLLAELPFATEQQGFVPTLSGVYVIGSDTVVAINSHLARHQLIMANSGNDFALPLNLSVWLVSVALIVLLGEAIVSGWQKRRLPTISALRVISLSTLALALFNAPLPWLQQSNHLAVVSEPYDGKIARPDAIALAQSRIPTNEVGQIVLTSELATGVRFEHQSIKAPVHQLLQATGKTHDVSVAQLQVAKVVLPGEVPLLTAIVHSENAQSATFSIAVDGETVAEQTAKVKTGTNRVETLLPKLAKDGALVEFSVLEPDAYPQNNLASVLIQTPMPRKIAVIASNAEQGKTFVEWLSDQDIEADLLELSRIPHFARDWLKYGAIVTLDMPGRALSTGQQSLIETLVAEHGLGLIILGGPNSFGPGGYFGTPLETLSPLSSRVPQDAPEVSMVFVLDRSGSMQQAVGRANRLDVAKIATISATKLLNPRSQIGIVAFDEEARTVLPLTRVETDPSAVELALAGFDPGGGTDILPGLERAAELLEGSASAAKHVIVMTDGLSQPTDYTGVVARLRATGATVSAVAVGQGADANAARTIASLGGGAAHVSSDFAALPAILSQEAMLLSSPVEEGEFIPVWKNRSEGFTAALPIKLPTITGFVATTAKPEAQVLIGTTDSKGRDMPLLGWWRYGNGLVLASTTDATGQWSQAWQRLPAYGTLWVDIIRHFQTAGEGPGLNMTTRSDGNNLIVEVTALDTNAMPISGLTLAPSITGPTGNGVLLPLRQLAAGRYGASLQLHALGRYEVTLDSSVSDQPVRADYVHAIDATHAYSPDRRAAALSAQTDGRIVTSEELEDLKSQRTIGWIQCWPAWALAAFGLFLFDLTLRYRGFPLRRRMKQPVTNSSSIEGNP
jgi:uncharacterized protein YegL